MRRAGEKSADKLLWSGKERCMQKPKKMRHKQLAGDKKVASYTTRPFYVSSYVPHVHAGTHSNTQNTHTLPTDGSTAHRPCRLRPCLGRSLPTWCATCIHGRFLRSLGRAGILSTDGAFSSKTTPPRCSSSPYFPRLSMP